MDPTPRRRWLAAAGALLVATTVAVVAATVPRRPAAPPPQSLGVVPEFALVERSGRPLRRADLQGRVWVADFIFTTCSGLCPAMTARMARLQQELPSDVWFVTFTVDPQTDTPEALRAYSLRFRAGERWLFVTGEKQALYDLSVGGFKLAAFEVPKGQREPGSDGPFLHSSKFVLVDGAGTIRGYYDSAEDPDLRDLGRDVRRLVGAR